MNIIGLSPQEYLTLAPTLEIFYSFHSTPVGNWLIGTTQQRICFIAFAEPHDQTVLAVLKEEWPGAVYTHAPEKNEKLIEAIFSSAPHQPHLLIKGSPFRIAVLKALLEIPHAHTITYKDLALQSGNSAAIRAAASHIAKNCIAYLIPCHRVVRKSGEIGEYRWGSHRKKMLLAYEKEHSFL